MNLDYIAGFFDADGHVLIMRCRKRRPDGSFIMYYTLGCGFTNNCRDVLEQIRNFFGVGGHIYCHKKREPHQGKTYHLRYQTKAASLVLARLVPYLVVKQERAKLGLEFQADRVWPGRRRNPDGGPSRRANEADYVRDSEMRERMIKLNGTSSRARFARVNRVVSAI